MSKGFTLFELIVVVVILAILSVMAFPALSDYIKRTQLKITQGEITDFVQQMRTDAIKSGQNLVLCASLDGETCKQSEQTDWSSGLIAHGEKETNRVIAQLMFSNRHLSIVSSDTIEFTNLGTAKDQYQIQVGMLGQNEVNICIDVSGHVNQKETCNDE